MARGSQPINWLLKLETQAETGAGTPRSDQSFTASNGCSIQVDTLKGKIPLPGSQGTRLGKVSLQLLHISNLVQLEDCQKFSSARSHVVPTQENILMTRKMLMVKWYMKKSGHKTIHVVSADLFKNCV